MRVGAAVLACGVLALGILAGASAARAKYGGTLVVRLTGDPTPIDPTLRGAQALSVYRVMCYRLYEYAENHGQLELAPVLAAAPPLLSPDRRSYTIQLRQGIEFNDGTPFNAQAVVTNYQHYTTYPGSIRASDFASVDNVTATGPLTVVFHLKQRDSTFTGNMFVLSPTALASEGANFAAHPVCAGPFMFDSQVPGVSVAVVKSPYWYKRGAVYLDKIVFTVMSDDAAALAALQAGDLEVSRISTSQVQAAQQSPGLKVVSGPTMQWVGVQFNMSAGTPFAQSAKLRLAFEEAIDRTTLNKVVFSGSQIPDCNLMPPADTPWFAETKGPCTPYDPTGAERLIALTGFQSPSIHLMTATTSPLPLVAQFIQAEEAAVGIKVVIDSVPSPTFIASTLAGNFDAALNQSSNDPAPSILVGNFFASNGSLNIAGYSSPRMDYVLENALKAIDPKARGVYYRVAQQIVHDDRPTIVLYHPIAVSAYNANLLAGVGQTPLGQADLVNAHYK
jgi:peptide/nickel transport system substrate-binding protein